ncbi:PQQ-dependent sugar dehydrogenase [Aestuariirhabdus litorea]|uniref:PQQ-dependent sugar dehydrogenase n=1 Tax=Aestuariirhabdus litorea TaxID=2528527 RepID=A0A3P3VLX0_9GAMM|nr:PQQ-dependent sugar dehydrogenase [Aestuariirhabdus litorea]RRJ83762.1 PQQ-dependent sugar dehydrogenase [Aestuariirhabdus litorea]RWW96985.1 PQQ-dependent sugar dehydrogenase [Endozoicomonadaceae bacterium GTF-13]
MSATATALRHLALLTGLVSSLLWAADEVKYELQVVADGLDHPWSLSFLPDGRMLVTERAGRLRMISASGIMDSAPVRGVPRVFDRSQGGLFEAVPHPDFANNGLIYLSYAWGDGDANGTRLARARLEGNALRDLEVLFTVEPLKDTPVHYGGRLAFMPDGTLLLTTGDGFDYREQAQKLDSLLGKVVRLNDDGSIPADNPFVGQADARGEIYSYGHRNPQGLLYDEESGTLYLHEHGPKGGDEINILEPGNNYGWPVITYGRDYSGATISPYTEYEGMEQPLIYWTPSIAPSGVTIYRGNEFPQWQGDLLVGALAGRQVRLVELDQGRVVGQQPLFTELGERIRDVRSGPDGRLYLISDSSNGTLYRVVPKP